MKFDFLSSATDLSGGIGQMIAEYLGGFGSVRHAGHVGTRDICHTKFIKAYLALLRLATL